MPTRLDLTDVAVGETLRIVAAADDGAVPPVAIPLVAASANPRCELRDRAGGALLATATCTVTDEAAGEVTVVVETAGISAPRALFDLWVTFPSGDTRRILVGSVQFDQSITDIT